MFGYIVINKPELKIKEYDKYHAFYCGLCRALKQKYGISGQMTLTYEEYQGMKTAEIAECVKQRIGNAITVNENRFQIETGGAYEAYKKA